MNGLIALQKEIEKESLVNAKWYKKENIEPIPVPILGPDLIDPRRNKDIATYSQQKSEQIHSRNEGEGEA
jgi:NADH-quinone oxidoreductase subunit B